MNKASYGFSWLEIRRTDGDGPRRRRGAVGPGWVPVMPLEAKDGFFTNYRWHLALSAVGLLCSAFFLYVVLGVFPALGGGTLIYLMVAGGGVLMSLALPFFWYVRHRQMRRVLDAEEEADELLLPE